MCSIRFGRRLLQNIHPHKGSSVYFLSGPLNQNNARAPGVPLRKQMIHCTKKEHHVRVKSIRKKCNCYARHESSNPSPGRDH